MYDGGEIVLVRNIVFNNGLADHASLKGRPCIVLSDFDEKITMIPLSKQYPRCDQIRRNIAIIDKKDIINLNNFNPKGTQFTNLSSMFQREIRFYNILAQITLDRYYKLLCEIEEKQFENNELCCDIYESIYQDLEYKRNQLKLKLKR